MNFVKLTEHQSNALTSIKRAHDSNEDFILLDGYAGTGKSAMIPHIVRELKARGATVQCAAFTHKACDVLRKIGLDAVTMHSLMYRCVSAPDPNEHAALIKERGRLLAELEDVHDDARMALRNALGIIGKRLEEISILRFAVKDNRRNSADGDSLTLTSIDVLIIDEGSMIPKLMWDDLEKHFPHLTVIAIRDPAQLPPVEPEEGGGDPDPLSWRHPTAKLTDICRQGKDSPIIAIAHRIRMGAELTPMDVSNEVGAVKVINVGDADHAITGNMLAAAGLIVVGTNDRRRATNDKVREAHGLPYYPSGDEREKLIMLNAYPDLMIFTNQLVRVANVKEFDDEKLEADVFDGERYCGRHLIWRKPFDQSFLKMRLPRLWLPSLDPNTGRVVLAIDWAFAVTCHKAQGSQADHVIVYDDAWWWTGANHWRWQYTSFTRAAKTITYVLGLEGLYGRRPRRSRK